MVTLMIKFFWNTIKKEKDKFIHDVTLYQPMIGSHLYLGLRIRLDISRAVLILARFQSAPASFCFQAARRLLRYLNGTRNYGLKYKCGTVNVNCFVDSEYAGDVIDWKSMSGYMVKFGNAMC